MLCTWGGRGLKQTPRRAQGDWNRFRLDPDHRRPEHGALRCFPRSIDPPQTLKPSRRGNHYFTRQRRSALICQSVFEDKEANLICFSGKRAHRDYAVMFENDVEIEILCLAVGARAANTFD
ncbi:MAG: hypothetical protein AB1898_12675 [Acidobacteriota bacterium]